MNVSSPLAHLFRVFRHLLNFILIVLSVAYCASNGNNIIESGDGISPTSTLAIALTLVLYKKKHTLLVSQSSLASSLCAAILSTCMLLGLSLANHHALDSLFASPFALLKSFFILIGMFLVFHLALLSIWSWFDKKRALPPDQKTCSKLLDRVLLCAERHSFTFAFVVIIAAWVPMLLIFAPGVIGWDSGTQLNMFLVRNHSQAIIPGLLRSFSEPLRSSAITCWDRDRLPSLS